MSAIAVSVPQAHDSVDRLRAAHTNARPCPIIKTAPATVGRKSSSNRGAADWRLTDRGIAVVMVIAAIILTVAIAVIGLTAVRVTSPGGDAGLHETRHSVQRVQPQPMSWLI
jgi:hypothetical protein